LKKRQLMAEVEDFLEKHGIPLDPRAAVGSLPFALPADGPRFPKR